MIPFIIGEKYSRNDIYKIIDVPKSRQGGIWNTGYNIYNDDVFVFANINSPGTTGHNHGNRFIGDDLQWFSKANHSINTPSIQYMINPLGNVYIFTRDDNKNVNFTYRGIASVKEYDNINRVRILWEFINDEEYHQEKTTEEITTPNKFIEGATKTITVNTYERNPIARSKCIQYYGCKCKVCGFDFEEIYGAIGADFIHVHHLKDLSMVSKEYEVDPITDLIPVCPNCHAMLHKRKPAFSVSMIKSMLKTKYSPKH